MAGDGQLDLRRASEAMTPLMSRPAGGGNRRIRAAGDLAPTLAAAGHGDDAVAFEGLVHRLVVAHGASVICAYPIPDVCVEGNMASLLRLSAEHATLEFPEKLWLRAPRLATVNPRQ